MIYPKEFTQRDAINSLTGIKSSLYNLRKVVSLTYLLYIANKKKSSIVYAESKEGKIVLKQEYKTFIQQFLNNSEIIENIDDNPLLTSQIESLYVGLTLMFALGRISFENTSLPITKERTGGIRYPKKIDFASNIIILDLMLSADSETSVKETLLAWLQDKQLDNKNEQRISIFLNTCIENNLFKLRHGEDDLYFQTEGIYKSLMTGNEVSLETDEIVGPTRILNSMLRENLIPWLNFKKSLLTVNENNDFNVKEYSDIITTSLSIRDIKVDNNVESAPKEEDNNRDEKQYPLQQIFYGAPGTGKSHKVKELTGKDNVVRTTFHPDSDYSSFVGCYKPTSIEVPMRDVTGKVIVENGQKVTENRIVYEFVEQAFLKAYIKAWKMYAEDENNPEKQYLVIEEINRGNCAQIFGDLFQLLDRGDNGFSEYPINADKDMQKHLAKAFMDMAYLEAPAIGEMNAEETARAIRSGEKLILPSNLYIWATMNTSDQSLFPIDSAFKRRWDWQYVPIHDGGKGWQIEADGKRYDWWQFVDAMNDKIGTATYSEDKKLGYFFCKAKDGVIDAETFVGKVVFYIWNDVFKDFAEEAGNLFKDVDGSMLSFNKFYTIGIDGKRKVVGQKIAILMQNLGVEPITTSNSANEEVAGDVEEEMQNDIFGNQRKESLISISIPNHPIIKSSDSTQFDAFIKALRIIGFERIKSVAPNLKYKRLGNIPVISTQRNEIIDNNNKGYSYYEEGGLFIIKGCKYYTYIRILEDLNSMLNIGLSMETK